MRTEVPNDKLVKDIQQKLIEDYKQEINREQYINNPVYHYLVNSQLNALLAGRKDWYMFGKLS